MDGMVCGFTPNQSAIMKICWSFVRAGDLALPDMHPKKSFIVEAIEKEIRLSFANRIKGTLPEAYADMIRGEKEKDLPDFPYDLEGLEAWSIATDRYLNQTNFV